MRLPNPTNKRLAWIGKNFPAPVLYDTIAAFAEATAIHSLARQISEERNAWRLPSTGQPVEMKVMRPVLPMRDGEVEVPFSLLSPQRAVELVEFYMRTSGRPGMVGGNTPYDRYLPWVARTLGRAHKALFKTTRRQFAARRHEEGTRFVDEYTDAVGRALIKSPDLDAASALSDQYIEVRRADEFHPGVPSAYPDRKVRIAAGMASAHGTYSRAAATLIAGFRNIAEWAEAETVDLNEYDLSDALSESEQYAEAQAEKATFQEEWADVADGSRVVYEWPDGWTVQELLSTRELFYEGTTLRHCIKDYSVDDLVMGGGESRVYSLRDPENKPVVTMEWSTTERRVPSSGLRGFANKTPELTELSRLYEFRRRCPVFDPGWDLATKHVTYPVNRGENWEGRYTRRAGRDEFGNSIYETVDVYSVGVFGADQMEWGLAQLIESTGHSSWEQAYEGALESDFPDWKPTRPHDQCEPAVEYADEHSREAIEDVVRHFDPTEDLSDWEHMDHFDFHANMKRVTDPTEVSWGAGSTADLAWLHWLVKGEELPGWSEGDEMVDWLDELRADRTLLPGMAPIGPESGSMTGPTQGGWVRQATATRGDADTRWHDKQLHPTGRPVGEWCVSSDLADGSQFEHPGWGG